ncbi:hypothetical protein K438DRAFT_1758698 [Mycena galopus ATCC 62051]|nr:hypothetical protein K438DRAFT_1758698 [Mycena galopus ATCC 62051]
MVNKTSKVKKIPGTPDNSMSITFPLTLREDIPTPTQRHALQIRHTARIQHIAWKLTKANTIVSKRCPEPWKKNSKVTQKGSMCSEKFRILVFPFGESFGSHGYPVLTFPITPTSCLCQSSAKATRTSANKTRPVWEELNCQYLEGVSVARWPKITINVGLLSRAVYAVPRETERIHCDGFWQRLARCPSDPMYRGFLRGGFWRKIKNALCRGTGLQASRDSLGLKEDDGVYVQGAADTQKPHEVEINPITTRIAIPSWKAPPPHTRIPLAKAPYD